MSSHPNLPTATPSQLRMQGPIERANTGRIVLGVLTTAATAPSPVALGGPHPQEISHRSALERPAKAKAKGKGRAKAMPHAFLHRHRGAAVKLHINGRSAAGILGFAEDGSPVIASLCFTEGHFECAPFSHVLAEHEIATLRRNGPRRLTSAITLTHSDGVLPSDYHFTHRPAVSDPGS